MIKTLYVRVIITFLAIIIFSLLCSLFIGLYVFQQQISYEGQNEMISVGKEIIHRYDNAKPSDPDEFLRSMVKISAYPIHLFNHSGEHTFYGLKDNPAVIINPEAVKQVLQGQYYRSTTEEHDTFIGMPFLLKGEWQAMFLQYSAENENIVNRMMFFVLLLVLLLGSLCILIAARYLVEPIKALTRATRKLAKGDFEVELKVNRVDEIGELTRSYVEMAGELKQLEQMRQDFVSNVSHEIQTPLTSISGFAKALQSHDLIVEEERNEYLEIIIAESGRLSRLSDNLLKLASLDSEHHPFKPTSFHLDEQIRTIVVTCEPQWSSKGILIDLEFPEAVTIEADEDQLKQVWMNLLSNSIKFTPGGGDIRIRIDVGATEMAVTISDSGIGISPEEFSAVFQRFYKVDKSRNGNNNGNGLGLAIVKKIVSLHQGDIEVNSAVGEGTTIIVRLPLSVPGVSGNDEHRA
ncbi:two-component sensor histidine kinase [Bacillus sp. FJAT-27264]|uniref:HAMP domain-containing sensor histidine kinase n=1 Tax=Paenibacillus sp. (strain DSM 101736 / FJAT-27264) TaxID=1850362 RepID=UPI00080802C3|nr:HAMP domain-containing sensor histidine kinase [Bacillus sp. FJAT-27264]OBZ18593.1 two-component sensor histidine kinase [Bacillus sp. FJAT-27264]